MRKPHDAGLFRGILPLFPPAAFLCLALGCDSFQLKQPVVEQGGTSEKERHSLLPGKHSFRIPPFLFFADFELKRDEPIFRELAGHGERVSKTLQLPAANKAVSVYLFQDRDRYERYMHSRYPDLPQRRAFFVAQPRSAGGAEDLLVYTYWGDRIQEDLRHELTHALLHGVLKDVPLWMDEGLAEYFELPPDQKGINRHHLEQLRNSASEPFRADLDRLEQLSSVQEMSPAEYREAWAWVHWMLCGPGEARTVLLAYLQKLRSTPNPGPLKPLLAEKIPAPEDELEKYLRRLESGPRPKPTAKR